MKYLIGLLPCLLIATASLADPLPNTRLRILFDEFGLDTRIRDEVSAETSLGICFVILTNTPSLVPVVRQGNHPSLRLPTRVGLLPLQRNKPEWLYSIPPYMTRHRLWHGLPAHPPQWSLSEFSEKVFRLELQQGVTRKDNDPFQDAKLRIFPVRTKEKSHKHTWLVCYQLSGDEGWFDLVFRVEGVDALRVREDEKPAPTRSRPSGGSGIALGG